MEMQKVNLSAETDQLQMTMGFSKIDKENRRVIGFATLDNLDRQSDIVLSEASKNAFSRFAGNIREMHDSKKAVGRMVNFTPQTHYDPVTDKTYEGVLVDVFVSKGAEDTWQKVLDGTLTGFSIAGPIKDAEKILTPEADGTVRVIKDYDLTELSLVDTPANQLAGIVSIVKNADGQNDHLEGLISKAEVRNVFFCDKDNVTILNKSENHNCPFCRDSMTNIGWVEKSESENEMIKSLLAKFKGEELKKNGGTETMAEAVNETVEAPQEVEKSDTAEVPEAVTTDAPEALEKSEAVEEASEAAEQSFEKSVVDTLAALSEQINELTKSYAVQANGLATVMDSVQDIKKSLTDQTSAVDSLKDATGEVTKRLESVEKETAVKKSAEVGPSEDGKVQKSLGEESFWGSRFVRADQL